MPKPNSYLGLDAHPAVSIVIGVDRDVERGEDILMMGYFLVLMAPLFAPFTTPKILLPLMALAFVVSVCRARANFHAIKRKLQTACNAAHHHDLSRLRPIQDIFEEHPRHSLADGFNPIKNRLRTLKSFLGGLLINPLWMPIFYALGLQFAEEKQLQLLNQAVITVEKNVKPLADEAAYDAHDA